MYEDGTFIIKGRLADAIRFKVFSEVVHPGPIEEVMSKHPAIANISVSIGFSAKVQMLNTCLLCWLIFHQ